MSKASFRDRAFVVRYLARALRESRLAVFLGSGVSRDLVNSGAAAIGLPTWRTLIRRLYVSSGRRAPSGKNYVQQAEDFKNWFLETRTFGQLQDAIQKALYEHVVLDFAAIRQNATLSGIGALVAQSRRGHASEVFTFNFDDILERYLGYYGVIARPIIEEKFWARAADVLVHHPHGFLPSPGSSFAERSSFLVFDERSYLQQHPDTRWNQRMEVAMQANVCLFVGLGRDDIHLKQLVERTSTRHAFVPAKDGYWGIVLRADPTPEEVRDWRQYHVHVEAVKNYGEDLPTVLFNICQEAARGSISRRPT